MRMRVHIARAQLFLGPRRWGGGVIPSRSRASVQFETETSLGTRGGKMAQLEDKSIWQDGEARDGLCAYPAALPYIPLPSPPPFSLSPLSVGGCGRRGIAHDNR